MIPIPRRQVAIFCAGAALALLAFSGTLALRSLRLRHYNDLDRTVQALLQAGHYRRAIRLVYDAISTCRRAGAVPPAVYAAAALVSAHPDQASPQDLRRALACLDAAFDSGYSPIEHPELRELYVRTLFRLRRYADLVAVLEEFPVEQLLPGEQQLLVRALIKLALYRDAYRVCLQSLAGTLDGSNGRSQLWQFRGHLARRLDGTDWWQGVKLRPRSRWPVSVAEAELAALEGRNGEALQRLRRLVDAAQVPGEVRAAARYRLAALLLADGSWREAARTLLAAPPSPLAASAWQGVLQAALASDDVELRQVGRWFERLAAQPLRAADRRAASTLAQNLLQRALRADDQAIVRSTLDAAGQFCTSTALATLCVTVLEGERDRWGTTSARELALRLATLVKAAPSPQAQRYAFAAARVFAAQHAYAEAVELALRSAAAETLSDAQLTELAVWLRRAGELAELARLQRWIGSGTGALRVRVWIRLQLALACLAAGRVAEARTLLQENLHEGPALAPEDRHLLLRSRLALAGACVAEGNYGETCALLADAGVGDVDEPLRLCRDFLYGMALYEQLQTRSGRRSAWGRSEARGIYVRYRQRLYRELCEVLTRVLEQGQGTLGPGLVCQAALMLARAHYEMGRYEEALAVLQRAPEVSGFAVELAVEQANCYWKLGQRTKAEQCLRAVSQRRTGKVASEPPERIAAQWISRALDQYL